MSEFAEWDSFYLIVGTAAGALIGLQFVVMTLIAQRPPQRGAEAGDSVTYHVLVSMGNTNTEQHPKETSEKDKL